MPFANLVIAQVASAWIAAPFLVSFVMTYAPEGPGRFFFYVVAAVAAVIVWIAGFIGSGISPTIPRPGVMSLALVVAAAVAAAWASATYIAPVAEGSEGLTYLFNFAPIAAAIATFMFAAQKPA